MMMMMMILMMLCCALFIGQLFIATIWESNDNSPHFCHSSHMYITIQQLANLGTMFTVQEVNFLSPGPVVNEEIPA